jgi:hypothetical protein
MESKLDFSTDAADVTIAVRGIATRAEFQRLFRDLPSNPGFRLGMKILLDLWELDVGRLTADDARAIGNGLIDEAARYGRARLAVFAPTTSSFGLTQIAEHGGECKDLAVSVSETYDEAVAWLARDERRPPRE